MKIIILTIAISLCSFSAYSQKKDSVKKTYVITDTTVAGLKVVFGNLFNYLKKRPYEEVKQLMDDLNTVSELIQRDIDKKEKK